MSIGVILNKLCPGSKWSAIEGLLPKSPGANIKEFLLPILSETKRPQIQCLSLKASFEFAVKRTLEWSKSLFRERKWIWATAR